MPLASDAELRIRCARPGGVTAREWALATGGVCREIASADHFPDVAKRDGMAANIRTGAVIREADGSLTVRFVGYCPCDAAEKFTVLCRVPGG